MSVYVEPPPKHASDENLGKLSSSTPPLLPHFLLFLVLRAPPNIWFYRAFLVLRLQTARHTHTREKCNRLQKGSRRPYKTTRFGLVVTVIDIEQVNERDRPVRSILYRGARGRLGVHAEAFFLLFCRLNPGAVAYVLPSLVITAIRRVHAASATRLNVSPLVYLGWCVAFACVNIPAVSRCLLLAVWPFVLLIQFPLGSVRLEKFKKHKGQQFSSL